MSAVGSSTLISNTTGSFNTAIGAGATATVDGLTNVTVIGADATVTSSNSLILGGIVPNQTYPTVGIGTSSPDHAFLLDVEGNAKVSGNLNVGGVITAGTKDFKIDHPINREKYLYHASIESSEMKNLYDGDVKLNARGEAVVQPSGLVRRAERKLSLPTHRHRQAGARIVHCPGDSKQSIQDRRRRARDKGLVDGHRRSP